MTEITAVAVPKWGIEMKEGTLVEWLKGVGDQVAVGDEVFEMESDKATNVWEAPHAGVLRRLLAEPGETHPVGALIGIIADAGTDDAAIDEFIAEHATPAPAPPAPDSPRAAPAAPAPAPPALASAGAGTIVPESLRGDADDSAVAATSRARRRAAELGVNLANVPGSGPGGRVSVDDIHRAIIAGGGKISLEAKAGPPRTRARSGGPPRSGEEVKATAAPAEEVPLSAMRRTIGARLQASKQQSPHFRVSVDAILDPLLALRAEFNASGSGVKVSVNDLIIKAAATALTRSPMINVQFDEDAGVIRKHLDADIAVAVATGSGLITPIVTAANSKSVTAISTEVRDLAGRAQAGTLTPDEYQGGTFTVSNLGMYGVRSFDAIINPPQVSILAVGTAEARPIAQDGEVVIATVATLTLASDHRFVDGEPAARFMGLLKELLEQPSPLLA